MNYDNDLIREGILEAADELQMAPSVLATIISYETAGTFDARKAGPRTQWGQHRGFIQFGEPQAVEHGVDWADPIGSQLGRAGAVVSYFRKSGWQPGMSEEDAYSIVNAGGPGLGHRTDANNGGAPGTVADKVRNQFGPHREKAVAFLGGTFAASSMSGYAPSSVNGTNMQQLQDTPNQTFRSTRDDREMAAAAEAERPSLWEATKMAVDDGWIATTAARQIGRAGFEADDNFQFSPELWDKMAGDLPEDYQRSLSAAVSEDHARVLSEQARRSFEVDQKLGQMGWAGVGLRLGAAMLDPVAVGASIMTEGAAAPMIYGQKISRGARFLRGGAVAAGTNAGLESYMVSQDHLGSWEDIGFAAAAGFALGGVSAQFGRIPEDAALQREAGKLARQMRNTTTLPNDGNLSAARATPLPDPKLTTAEIIGERFEDSPKSAFGNARFDMTGMLKNNDNPVVRQVGAILGQDAVGNADGSVNITAASERVSREMRTRTSRFYRDYNSAFTNWAKENGKAARWRHEWDPSVRAEFNREVGHAVRRELDGSQNAHVQKVAGRIKTEMKDLLQYGKDKNIRGFGNITEDMNYLTRRYRIERLDELVSQHGEGTMNRLMAESMMRANKVRRNRLSQKGKYADELEYDVALDMAKAFIKSIRSRKFGDFNVQQAFNGDDMTALRAMLDDAGLEEANIDKITDAIRLKQDNGDKGRIAEAKFRMDLDETHSIRMADGSSLGIEDFLENDAEALFMQYTRSVIGAGEIEDAFSAFKVPDAEGAMPLHAPSWATVKGYAASNHTGPNATKADWNRAEKRMDALYRSVAGIAHEPPSDGREAMRLLRDYNFSRIGGQLGFAQLGDFGNILGAGGMRGLMQALPSLRHIFTTAKNGKFSEDLLNEIEAIWGFGTDLVRTSPSVRMDDVYGGTFEGRNFKATSMQRLDHGLQQAKKLTTVASGMAHVNMVLQRLNGRVIVQRFLDDASGKKPINQKRLRALGIPDDMHPRIQEQMLKHVDQTEGLMGRKVSRINIDQWDDVDAKNSFINGVNRWATRTVQENDPGNMPAYMTSEMGKTIMQFRSFMLASYSKQLLSGIHHRDWETFSGFMSAMLFGGIFYAGQTYINSIGRPDRQEFLDRQLSAPSIGKAAFQRAGFSSIIPMAVDTIIPMAGFQPVFDYRFSGLKGGDGLVGAILGNPTVDLIDNLDKGLKGTAASMGRDDYTFSQQDWRSMTSTLMFQNALIVRNGLAMIGGGLPRWSQ